MKKSDKMIDMEYKMSLEEFNKKNILENIHLDKNIFGKIYTFIDFGNVNYWFKKDRGGLIEGEILKNNEIFEIDFEKMSEFLKYFSEKNMFYYGINSNLTGSVFIINRAREYFKVITKEIQKIRGYADIENINLEDVSKSLIKHDNIGYYVYINKCNFDVEITIDAIKLFNYYDTFCILSGDSDFIELFKYLKCRHKKIILIKKGFVKKELEQLADLVINAIDIKKEIVFIKCKNPAI